MTNYTVKELFWFYLASIRHRAQSSFHSLPNLDIRNCAVSKTLVFFTFGAVAINSGRFILIAVLTVFDCEPLHLTSQLQQQFPRTSIIVSFEI